MTRIDAASIDPEEVARFSALAAEWWNPSGKFGVLHKFNPVRLAHIREVVSGRFGRDSRTLTPFTGLRILDIGCGGGLLSEPVARLGAEVVGVDPSEKNIKTAAVHARENGVSVDYRATTAEALMEAGETFDVVLNMEVVEHVNDVHAFVTGCASMVRPGGMMIIATINRTLKARAMAIFGAERVLGWLPVGTHTYEKLVRPQELVSALEASAMQADKPTGVVFDPFGNRWKKSADIDVNYMIDAYRN